MAAGAFAAWTYTVKQVAVNAVIAGCEPEYFPVVLAVASSGMAALGSSTTSFAYSMVINGPIRRQTQYELHDRRDGTFRAAERDHRRAWTLIGKNLGKAESPCDTYMGSQGNNTNYNNIVIAENEKDSPSTRSTCKRDSSPKKTSSASSPARTFARATARGARVFLKIRCSTTRSAIFSAR